MIFCYQEENKMSEDKKYKLLTTDRKSSLFRIKALKDFGNVKAGDLGGYIASEENLSQAGSCWVYRNARVSGDAQVSGDARVFDNAWVYDDAWVYGNARVSGDARVFDNAWVYDDAWVFGDAQVSGDARVFDNARVSGDVWVYGDALVFGNAWVFGNVQVCGDAVATKPVISLTNVGKHNITITDTHIAIGCENHTISHWKKNIKKIGVANGYSEAEIKKTISILKAFL